MHRKRVTCELHDSYFRSMMIKTCHSKDGGSGIFHWPFMESDWVDVELLYNSVHRKFKEFGDQTSLERRCDRESQHPAKGALRPPINRSLEIRELEKWCCREKSTQQKGPQAPAWAAKENGKETLMAIRVRFNMLQFCSVSNSLSHTTLSNKVRGIFFLKDCVVFIIVSSLWLCMHLHMSMQHVQRELIPFNGKVWKHLTVCQ